MNSFLKNMIHRHRQGNGLVQARKRGVFESPQPASDMGIETREEAMPSPPLVQSQHSLPNTRESREIEADENPPSESPAEPGIAFPKPKGTGEVTFHGIEWQPPARPEPESFPLAQPEKKAQPQLGAKLPKSEKRKENKTEAFTTKASSAAEERTTELLLRLQADQQAPNLIRNHQQFVNTQHNTFLQAQSGKLPPQEASPPPAIKVHIGRIEIKAVKESKKPSRRSGKPAPKIKSLDQILQEKDHK